MHTFKQGSRTNNDITIYDVDQYMRKREIESHQLQFQEYVDQMVDGPGRNIENEMAYDQMLRKASEKSGVHYLIVEAVFLIPQFYVQRAAFFNNSYADAANKVANLPVSPIFRDDTDYSYYLITSEYAYLINYILHGNFDLINQINEQIERAIESKNRWQRERNEVPVNSYEFKDWFDREIMNDGEGRDVWSRLENDHFMTDRLIEDNATSEKEKDGPDKGRDDSWEREWEIIEKEQLGDRTYEHDVDPDLSDVA